MTGQEVRAIRDRLGLTQEQLAELVGASQTAVWRWERGSMGVSPPYERVLMGLKKVPEKKPKETKDLVGMIAAGAALAAFAWLAYGIAKKEKNVKKSKRQGA